MYPPLNQSQFRRMNAGKNPLHACGFQPEHALEQACEHRPVVGQNRIVAVLKQACLLDLDLFAEDGAPMDAASHHPIDAAVAVIGAAVAILAEGAAELGDDDDNGIFPSCRSDLLGKARKRTAEFTETIGEITGGRALIDMGIPAADIDKAQVELFAHQPSNAPRRQLKAARRNRATVGRVHFLRYRFVDIVANPKPFRNRGSKLALPIHFLDQRGLAIVDARLAYAVDPDIANLRLAAEDQRELLGKGDRSYPRELGREPAHDAGTIVAGTGDRLTELNGVLGFKKAPGEVIAGAGKGNEGDFTLSPKRVDAVPQRRMQSPICGER